MVSLADRQAEGVPRHGRALRARYDAAQATDNYANWWLAADHKSADAAASASIRKTLRSRARYEIGNSPFAKRIINVLARDVIGTGPRLQMHLDDEAANRIVEREFTTWSRAIRLAMKLQVARKAKAGDGEAFLFRGENLGLPSDVVPLDVALIECDRVTTPVYIQITAGKSTVDGIEFDTWGNPAWYHVLKTHPGATFTSLTLQYDRVSADNLTHWFTPERPGQHRGVPEITAALTRLAEFRRWTNAVIDAAQNAAHLAMVFESTSPLSEDDEIPKPLEVVELERNAVTVAPFGHHLGQMKPEQPPATHRAFTRVILTEIGACFEMPYNIAVGDSSEYNYASGRLDHQSYFKKIRDERADCESVILDPLLKDFIEVGRHGFTGLDADALLKDWRRHTWEWDGDEHVDPDKESKGQERRLKIKTTSPQRECARGGANWEEVQDENLTAEFRERKQRLELQKKFGLSDEDMTKTEAARPKDPRGRPEKDDEDAGDAEALIEEKIEETLKRR